MDNNRIVTLQNYKEMLTAHSADLHVGHVSNYRHLFINQPENVVPPTGKIDSLFYLILDIRPNEASNLNIVYIDFVADGNAISPVGYIDGIGYVTKPISQFTALIDFLKMAKEANRQPEVLLQTNTGSSDVFVMS